MERSEVMNLLVSMRAACIDEILEKTQTAKDPVNVVIAIIRAHGRRWDETAKLDCTLKQGGFVLYMKLALQKSLSHVGLELDLREAIKYL